MKYIPQETTQQYLERFESYVTHCKNENIDPSKMEAIVANIKTAIQNNADNQYKITKLIWDYDKETQQYLYDILVTINGTPFVAQEALCPKIIEGTTKEQIFHDIIEQVSGHVKVKHFIVPDSSDVEIVDKTTA